MSTLTDDDVNSNKTGYAVNNRSALVPFNNDMPISSGFLFTTVLKVRRKGILRYFFSCSLNRQKEVCHSLDFIYNEILFIKRDYTKCYGSCTIS